jgi:hypothetical protein
MFYLLARFSIYVLNASAVVENSSPAVENF